MRTTQTASTPSAVKTGRTTRTRRTTRTTGKTDAARTARTARARAAVCVCVCTAALLAGCTAGPDPAAGGGSGGTAKAKNGDTAPLSGKAGAVRHPVPRGRGSRLPDDLNGDGQRDLVLNDLVRAPDDPYGDDPGIGIVYGTAGAGGGLDPAVRQTLGPRTHGARVDGVLPAAFDAEAVCDLDQDGYGDLIIGTDPPYDGNGMPPVPLQILFGGPTGPSGRAVVLRIPGKARFGNEWPDHPVCGDFDGDGKVDLAVTASAGQVSFLRGPFTRAGAPRGASAPVPGGGPVLEAPAPAADANDDGYDDLVHSDRARTPGRAGRGELLLGGPEGPGRPGGPYGFKTVTLPPAPTLPGAGPGSGSGTEQDAGTDQDAGAEPGAGTGSPGRGKVITELLLAADFTGDGRPDLVTRTHRGETTDLIALYASSPDGGGAGGAGGATGAGGVTNRPVITFSTSIFLG
ncbi:VCBS repeat-containing protein [Streptomyces sp. NPDC002018]|uniref:VCBS repeat-containing protein n=1 Tax=Streptomyces sp. NPDC002018 TaxID=3364629 RepID=UPI0036AB5901